MNTTQITPTQMHLLKLFSFDSSEKTALEIKDVLMNYFQGGLVFRGVGMVDEK